MRLREEVMDLVELDDTYNLSVLWGICHHTLKTKQALEISREDARYEGKLSKAAEYEKQLYFVNANLHNIKVVMLSKEDDIFEYGNFDIGCKN